MIGKRIAASVIAVTLAGAGMLASAPAASAATQNVTVNCTTSVTEDFNLAPGDTVVFDVNSAPCISLMNLIYSSVATGANIAGPGINSDAAMQSVVDAVANTSGTGGSAVADYASWTVTYTAGSTPGTDSLRMAPPAAPNAVSSAIDYGSNSFFMTVPGATSAAADDTPPAWFQSYGRHHSEDKCDAGWSPSWAEWMNGGKGGFVCNRVMYYDKHSHSWLYA